MSQNYISNLENGKISPSGEKLTKITETLGVTLNDLMSKNDINFNNCTNSDFFNTYKITHDLSPDVKEILNKLVVLLNRSK